MNKFFSLLFNIILSLTKGILALLKSIFSQVEVTPQTKNNYDFPKVQNNKQATKQSKPKNDDYSPESLLDKAMGNKFATQSLLNKEERKMYYELISNLNTKQFAIFPQASCGEIFYSKEAHQSINSKRADFCIVDKSNWFKPVSLIEVHGKGHFLRGSGNTAIRDATVKEACLKAGIKYHEYRVDTNQKIIDWVKEELKYLIIVKK